MVPQSRNALLFVVILVLVGIAAALQALAYRANGAFGFPLDDPWIHLQFAKNLREFGSFSYFRDEVATSGSTAPLYTLLLALGFFITSNEMMLSYALGVASYAGGAVFFTLLARRWFASLAGDLGPITFAALLFALDPRLQWISMSGMETPLFILLLLAVVYFYLEERPVPLGLMAGLLIWTRPEAIILFGALTVDLVYRTTVMKDRETGEAHRLGRSISWLMPALSIAAVFGVGYVLFNLSLSGSILPNTYAAKLKMYATRGLPFPSQVFWFFTTGHLLVLAPFVGLGILNTLFRSLQRRPAPQLVGLVFSSGLFLAYWWKLPYLYQNGRYLLPILPFLFFLGFAGVEAFLSFAVNAGPLAKPNRVLLARAFIYMVFVVRFALGSWEGRRAYADSSKYISDRQVLAGKWLRDNLPEGAIVATHDVGAIAYYSDRKVVDMVGLVSPEAIATIGEPEKLEAFLVSQQVTHLALLRNWFEAVNVDPLFQTDEQAPEIMEIFEFDSERVHLTSRDVSALTDRGWRLVSGGNLPAGGPMLEDAVRRDPMSSRAHHHLGSALVMAGRFDEAERELRAAIDLHPSYWDAHFALAQIPLKRGRTDEGVARLEELIQLNPNMIEAYKALADLAQAQGDSAKASGYLEEYRKRPD